MRWKRFSILLTVGLLTACGGDPSTSVQRADPSPTPTVQETIIPIDLLQAGEHAEPARAAIAIWNEALPSIRFVEQKTKAPLRVQAITKHGQGSEFRPKGLGEGTLLLNAENYEIMSPVRLVVHELGHSLSLDHDFDPKDACAQVMADAPVPPNCDNDKPAASEIAAVEAYFASHELGSELAPFKASENGDDSETISR